MKRFHNIKRWTGFSFAQFTNKQNKLQSHYSQHSGGRRHRMMSYPFPIFLPFVSDHFKFYLIFTKIQLLRSLYNFTIYDSLWPSVQCQVELCEICLPVQQHTLPPYQILKLTFNTLKQIMLNTKQNQYPINIK